MACSQVRSEPKIETNVACAQKKDHYCSVAGPNLELWGFYTCRNLAFMACSQAQSELKTKITIACVQTRDHYRSVAGPSMEPWGFYTCGDSAFMARGTALQRLGWLPAYANAGGHALGIECKTHRMYCAQVNECLVTGEP